MEQARAWAEAKANKMAMIARVNPEAKERAGAEDEERVREKNNAVKRAGTEAATKIRAKAEAKKGKRGRAEAEARAKAVIVDPSKAKIIEV